MRPERKRVCRTRVALSTLFGNCFRFAHIHLGVRRTWGWAMMILETSLLGGQLGDGLVGAEDPNSDCDHVLTHVRGQVRHPGRGART